MSAEKLSDAGITAVMALSHILENDPTLLPPDIQALAQQVDAVLGPLLEHEHDQSIADAIVRQTRAVLAGEDKGLVADALRYRWLRRATNTFTNDDGERINVKLEPAQWDAAIDKWLAAEKAKES
jgi:hypothetical protein